MFVFNQLAGTFMVMPDFDAALQEGLKVMLNYALCGALFYIESVKDLPTGAWV